MKIRSGRRTSGLIAALALTACGSSGSDVPDARHNIDALFLDGPAAIHVDAALPPDATPTSIAVTVTQGGVPVNAATVLADGVSGPQTQATTDDTGTTTVNVSGTSDLTIVVQLNGLAELFTMTGVAPGEAITFGLPALTTPTISVNVGGTAPDSSTNFDLWVPSPSNNLSDHQFQLAGNGMPSMIPLPANATTTPIDLVAISGDGTQYVGVPAQTYADHSHFSLPTNWAPLVPFTFSATGLPIEVTSVGGNMSMLSDGFGLSGGGTSMVLTNGDASGSMNFAPFGEISRSNMQVNTANQTQALNHATADSISNYTITGDNLLPWIENVVVGGTPLAVSWSTAASGGTAVLQGYIIEMQYTTTAGSVSWYATIDPNATSWTLPKLPSSLDMWSPVGATNVNAFPLGLNSSALTDYKNLRTVVAADINLLNGQGDALSLRDTTVSFPFSTAQQ